MLAKGKKIMKRKNLYILISLAVVLIVILIGVFYLINMDLKYSEPDIVILSPDGKFELVIREFDVLGGSGAEVYLKDLNNRKTKKTQLVFDDYTMPFKNGNYIINWVDEKVVIKYYEGVPSQNINEPDTWSVSEICFL